MHVFFNLILAQPIFSLSKLNPNNLLMIFQPLKMMNSTRIKELSNFLEWTGNLNFSVIKPFKQYFQVLLILHFPTL